MQVQPIPPGMAGAERPRIDRLARLPDTIKACTWVTPERDERLHRRVGQAGERWRLVRPGIHPAEPLDHRDRAPARLLEARGTCVLPHQTKHGAEEHGGHRCDSGC